MDLIPQKSSTRAAIVVDPSLFDWEPAKSFEVGTNRSLP